MYQSKQSFHLSLIRTHCGQLCNRKHPSALCEKTGTLPHYCCPPYISSIITLYKEQKRSFVAKRLLIYTRPYVKNNTLLCIHILLIRTCKAPTVTNVLQLPCPAWLSISDSVGARLPVLFWMLYITNQGLISPVLQDVLLCLEDSHQMPCRIDNHVCSKWTILSIVSQTLFLDY